MRIDENFAEISVALNARIVGSSFPGRSAIVGTIQSAFFSLGNNCVDALPVARDNHADAAQMCVCQLWNLDLSPGLAAVGGLVDSGAAHAQQTGKRSVGFDQVIPQSRESDLGIVGSECYIDGSRRIVLVQNLPPGLAAVGSLEDSALGVRREGMTQRRHQDDIGIMRIDPDCSDVSRVL